MDTDICSDDSNLKKFKKIVRCLGLTHTNGYLGIHKVDRWWSRIMGIKFKDS